LPNIEDIILLLICSGTLRFTNFLWAFSFKYFVH
jgi:hypothetical protein